MYGRPGMFIISVTAIAFILFAFHKRWAQRANWVLCTILVAYCVRSFFIFASCYAGICPVKQPALYAVLFLPLIMLVMAILPQVGSPKVENKQ